MPEGKAPPEWLLSILCKEFNATPSQIRQENYEDLMMIMKLRRYSNALDIVLDGNKEAEDELDESDPELRVDIWRNIAHAKNLVLLKRGLEPEEIDELSLRMPAKTTEIETYGQ